MSIFFVIDKSETKKPHKKISVEREKNNFYVTINGNRHRYDIFPLSAHRFSMINDGHSFDVTVVPQDDILLVEIGTETYEICLIDQKHYQQIRRAKKGRGSGLIEIKSPMPGKIVEILVGMEQKVEEGDGLVIVEAMKMENEIKAPTGGVVKNITVQPGETVDAQKVMVVLE